MHGGGSSVAAGGGPSVVVVSAAGTFDVAGALTGSDVPRVERVGDPERWTPDPETWAGCIVATHEPPDIDGLRAVRTLRDRVGTEVPAVLVLPPRAETTTIERVLDDEVTDYVRAFGDWQEHLLARVRSRVEDGGSTFRELYHATNDGLLLHDPGTGEVLHVNDRFREMLDFDPGAEVTLADITTPEAGFSEERARDMVHEAATDGRQVFEWLDETAGGDHLWTEVSLNPVTVGGRGYVMAAVRDISDRKARERELADARERLDATLERVEEAFVGLDEELCLTYVNEQAAAALELDPEAAVGASIWEVLPESVGTRFQREYEAAMAEQESRSFEAYYPPLEIWVEVRAYPDEDGLSVFFRDVTDWVERERDLKLYETLFENVRERLLVLDEDDRVEFATEWFAGWLGVDRATLVGDPLSEHLSEGAVMAVREAVRAIRVGEQEATTIRSETEADKRWRDVEVAVTLLPESAHGSVLCSVRDVTERVAAERSRDALVKNVPGMVYRYRTESALGMTFVSGACRSLTGYDPAALTEGRIAWQADVVHPDDREALRATLAAAVDAHEPFTATYRVVSKRGRTRWVREYGRPVTGADGNVATIQGIVVEVSEEITRERQRKVLSRVLRHNLRNEVQAILGFAEMIADRTDDDTVAGFGERILEAGESLAALSETASYIENTIEADGTGRPVELSHLLDTVVERQRETHPDADVRLESTSASVLADDTLAMAVDEVVENAVEHNTDPTVWVEVRQRDDRVAVRVRDDGDGLPERERAVVTGARDITQLDHGQGLGLWLAKWVVESYGGELDIEVDGGTEVTLSLPRAD